MSDSQIQVIDAQTEDNLTGLVIEGVPHLYWLGLYKALELSQDHAVKVIQKLTKGKHYVSYSRSEIKEIFSGNAVLSLLPAVRSYHFLTEEGYSRAIMEISTGHMNNRDVAAAIDRKKDEIANIYARYQQGEVLSKSTEHPALPGDAPEAYAPVAVVLEDQLAVARIMIGEGVEPAIARSMAFHVTEEITRCGDALTPWRPLIQADPFLAEPAILTPTDIGKELGGMTGRTVNQILVKLGYQKKVGSEWTPTQSGKIYARFVPQEIQHNRGVLRHMQLRWLPAVIEKIREKMYYEQKGQTGLFLGECGV